jgi:NAD-dependent SIR2 family protein deacetylase
MIEKKELLCKWCGNIIEPVELDNHSPKSKVIYCVKCRNAGKQLRQEKSLFNHRIRHLESILERIVKNLETDYVTERNIKDAKLNKLNKKKIIGEIKNG